MSVTAMALVFKYKFPELKTDDGKIVPDSTSKFVMIALADHASDDGENAYIGVRRVVEKTQFSTQTVCNALNALRHNGFITLVGKSKVDTNNYTINLDRFQPLESQDSSHQNPRTPATRTKPSFKPPVKPLATKPTQPSRSKLFMDALEKHFGIGLNVTFKAHKDFLVWAVDEKHITPEQVEFASNTWENDEDINWHGKRKPSIQAITENWKLLITGFEKQASSTGGRDDFIDMNGLE